MKKILIISSDSKLKEVLKFCFDGWGYEVFLEDAGLRDINPIKKISNEKVVEIKRCLKTVPGSKYMSDRRNRKDGPPGPGIGRIAVEERDSYKPIGRILLDNGALSPDQLDEGLVAHWKRGIVLGEVLKELGYITEDKLAEALKTKDLYK